MADNIELNAGTGGATIAADDVSSVWYQRVKLTDGTAESTTPILAGGGVESGALRVTVASDSTGVLSVDDNGASLTVDGTVAVSAVSGSVTVAGDIAHSATDSGNPVKVGMRALAHGTNPTAVDAAERTDWLANRAGIPWVIGGHPNVVSYGLSITSAITNVVIGPTVNAGSKFVVTGITVTCDNANTVFPTFVAGFATATTPAFATTPGTLKVIAGHPGIPAGGGFSRGDGSGIVGVGADDEELRITTTGAVTGMYVVVTGYTIES
jgi:hypothetical protein